MKNKRINLFILFLLFTFQYSFAQDVFTVESVPKPTSVDGGFLADPAHYLSSTDYARIRSYLLDIEKSTTAQISVVILPSIGEANTKFFATSLFEKWGIGQADVDNGLLILSVMDQRKTEFETGYGMEAVLTDVYCYRIGMQQLVPHFQQKDYGGGIMAALTEIRRILEDPNAATDIYSTRKKKNWKDYLYNYIVVNILFHLGVLLWVLLTLSSKTEYYDKYHEIRKAKWMIFVLLFPLPYLIVYFLLGALLKRLRHAPRFSRGTGNALQLLTEEEEDDFLEKGQITEEEIGTVDYDVWVDLEGTDVLILKYITPFSKYSGCPKCDYKTYRHLKTITIMPATYSSRGMGEKHYSCKNCFYLEKKKFYIAKKGDSSGGGGSGGGGGSSFGGGSSGGGGASVSW